MNSFFINNKINNDEIHSLFKSIYSVLFLGSSDMFSCSCTSSMGACGPRLHCSCFWFCPSPSTIIELTAMRRTSSPGNSCTLFPSNTGTPFCSACGTSGPSCSISCPSSSASRLSIDCLSSIDGSGTADVPDVLTPGT